MSTKAMSWALNDVRGIKPTTRLVLTKLADHANDDGVAWPGKKSLSETLEISKRSLDEHITKLVQLNLISATERKVNSGRNTTNIYQLHVGQAGLFDHREREERGEGAKSASMQNPAREGAENEEKPRNSAPEPNHLKQPLSASGDAEYYLSAKKRKLEGDCLVAFLRFWTAFNLMLHKAEAADEWLDAWNECIAGNFDLLHHILDAARAEAKDREQKLAADPTYKPKQAAGWIKGRRWENHQPRMEKTNGKASPAEDPWFHTRSGIQMKAEEYGIHRYHEEHKWPLVMGGLISRMQARGEEPPADLVAWYEKEQRAA